MALQPALLLLLGATALFTFNGLALLSLYAWCVCYMARQPAVNIGHRAGAEGYEGEQGQWVLV